METETIDKLFLELSQFTNATTAKELELKSLLNIYQRWAAYCFCCAKTGEDPLSFYMFEERQKRISAGDE